MKERLPAWQARYASLTLTEKLSLMFWKGQLLMKIDLKWIAKGRKGKLSEKVMEV